MEGKIQETISVRIPWAMMLDMDLQIARGLWPNRATLVRAAISAKLATSQASVAPFRELDELLKTFDKQYVEIWRDTDAARKLVEKVDYLKGKLSDFPDLLVKVRRLEKRSKLLGIARVDIGQVPPVTGASLYDEMQSKETDGFFEALDRAKKSAAAADKDTGWLDKMAEEFSEEASPNVRPGEEVGLEAGVSTEDNAA